MHWTDKIISDYNFKNAAELCRVTGVSRQFVSICKKRNTPITRIDSGLANRIAKRLGLTVDELLYQY